MSCWLWDLLTGDLEPVARTACWWLASAATYLADLPLDRYIA